VALIAPRRNKKLRLWHQETTLNFSAIQILEKTRRSIADSKKFGIRHIDYKDPDFLMQFVNEQGKLLPRRITGNSLKYQKKVAVAVKRARHLAILPYVTDLLK